MRARCRLFLTVASFLPEIEAISSGLTPHLARTSSDFTTSPFELFSSESAANASRAFNFALTWSTLSLSFILAAAYLKLCEKPNRQGETQEATKIAIISAPRRGAVRCVGGARLCEPQQRPKFHTLEFIPTRPGWPSCCESQTRAPKACAARMTSAECAV
jgi:hypothetical protein